jgi:hypothetical protein
LWRRAFLRYRDRRCRARAVVCRPCVLWRRAFLRYRDRRSGARAMVHWPCLLWRHALLRYCDRRFRAPAMVHRPCALWRRALPRHCDRRFGAPAVVSRPCMLWRRALPRYRDQRCGAPAMVHRPCVSRMCERKVQRRVDCACAKERSEKEDSLHGNLTTSSVAGVVRARRQDWYKTATRLAQGRHESSTKARAVNLRPFAAAPATAKLAAAAPRQNRGRSVKKSLGGPSCSG